MDEPPHWCTVSAKTRATSLDLCVCVCVSIWLPKAIHVSRKARGEITPALSLLSGPHPSVIVQVIL